ncbi:unnamed protein product, partial [marine sediment metagenome]
VDNSSTEKELGCSVTVHSWGKLLSSIYHLDSKSYPEQNVKS